MVENPHECPNRGFAVMYERGDKSGFVRLKIHAAPRARLTMQDTNADSRHGIEVEIRFCPFCGEKLQ